MKTKIELPSSATVIDPRCPWILPRLKFEFGRYEYKKSAAEWKALLARATQGDAEAELEVAVYYKYGCKDRRGRILVRRSSGKSLAWLRRSAEHGSAYGQCAFGTLLSDGEGVKKDPREALVWMKRAFRGGNTSAAPNNIAITYRENGHLQQAIRWFRKSVAFGDDGTNIQLGIHYYWGRGVRADYPTAVRFFRKATKGKNMAECERDDAFFYLGIAYLEGKGVGKSLKKARECLERAAKDNDHPAAQRLLKKMKSSNRQL
jgi:TPR repeat protein